MTGRSYRLKDRPGRRCLAGGFKTSQNAPRLGGRPVEFKTSQSAPRLGERLEGESMSRPRRAPGAWRKAESPNQRKPPSKGKRKPLGA